MSDLATGGSASLQAPGTSISGVTPDLGHPGSKQGPPFEGDPAPIDVPSPTPLESPAPETPGTSDPEPVDVPEPAPA